MLTDLLTDLWGSGHAVHEQEMVAGAGFERGLAQRDAASGGGVELPVILNDPAAGGELGVDLLAGFLFGCFRHWDLAH